MIFFNYNYKELRLCISRFFRQKGEGKIEFCERMILFSNIFSFSCHSLLTNYEILDLLLYKSCSFIYFKMWLINKYLSNYLYIFKNRTIANGRSFAQVIIKHECLTIIKYVLDSKFLVVDALAKQFSAP